MTGLAGTAECLTGVLALGGVGALASRNEEVIRKWRTWMMSAPLAAGCLWLGAPGAALLAACLGVTSPSGQGPRHAEAKRDVAVARPIAALQRVSRSSP